MTDIPRKVYRRAIGFINHSTERLLGALGLNNGFYQTASGARILIYHGVCSRNPRRFNSLFISKATFEKQLRFFRKYFHLLSLDDFYEGKFHPEKFNLCLSFDDGFANNFTYALPLLEQYQVPAAFFITAIRNENLDILWNDMLTIGSVEGPQELRIENMVCQKKDRCYYEAGTGRRLADRLRETNFEAKLALMKAMQPYTAFRKNKQLEEYWLQMTVDEIRQLSASPFVTVGSHGYFHNDLAGICREDLVSELVQSKSFLESVIQKPVRSLAFPYGSYSDMVVEEALHAGYDQLLAAEFNTPEDRLKPCLRERMGINPYIGVHSQLIAAIKGHYHA